MITGMIIIDCTACQIQFLKVEHAVASLLSLSLVDPANVMDTPCRTFRRLHDSLYYRFRLNEKMLTINSRQDMQLLVHRISYRIQVNWIWENEGDVN